MNLRPKNPRLLAELELFVLAPPENQACFDLHPFGIPIADDARIDPLRASSSPFMEQIIKLDRLTFGLGGMPMPRFLFFDASSLPSGIIGFARRAHTLPAETRAFLDLPPDYEGLVPLSMYIAIPMLEPGAFLGHNLASLAERLPHEELGGLGRVTKAVALKVLRAKAQVGMTQWDSRALFVHSRLGPLDLLTTWTPAHEEIASMTYRAHIDDAALLHLAGDPEGHVDKPAAELWIDSDDAAGMEALQVRIEQGERFVMVGPPTSLPDGRLRAAIAGTDGVRSAKLRAAWRS